MPCSSCNTEHHASAFPPLVSDRSPARRRLCAALPGPGRAAAPAAKAQGPGIYRYKLGDFQLTALYDGIWHIPIDDKFVRNASAAAVNEALGRGFPAPERAADFIHRARW